MLAPVDKNGNQVMGVTTDTGVGSNGLFYVDPDSLTAVDNTVGAYNTGTPSFTFGEVIEQEVREVHEMPACCKLCGFRLKFACRAAGIWDLSAEIFKKCPNKDIQVYEEVFD